MKKLITIFCIAAILANSVILTGCNSGETGSNNPESSSAVIENPGNSDNTESTENPGSESDPADPVDPSSKFSGEALRLFNELKVTGFTGPDGETVEASEAADIYDSGIDVFLDENGGSDYETTSTLLKYDFAYIRYARPYFYYSDKYPDDAKEKELEDEAQKLPEVKWFKVRAGDKLDCGLTVKRAEYLHYPTNYLGNALEKMEVEFDGEITLEGALYVSIHDDYLNSSGDIMFIPDPVQTAGIPVMSHNYWFGWKADEILRAGMPDGYAESDIGSTWQLGNINDYNLPIEGLTNGSTMRVRVTLNEISGVMENGFPTYSQFTAIIADIEEI